MPGPPLVLGRFTVDPDREELRAPDGRPVKLRPQAFAVLAHLAGNAGRVVTKDELMEAVWPGVAVTDDSLVQCIHEIRRALGGDGPALVRTVPRRGYLLEAVPGRAAPSRRLPRIAAATALVAGLAAALLWWGARPEPTPPREVTIAVLPFASDSTERSTGFAEALTDDIATELGRSRSLRVLARGSVAPFAGPPPDLKALARETGADYAIEGRLDLGPTGARVAARLVDTASGALAWSARYDRPGEDLFAIRDPLVTEIVGTLSGMMGVIWEEWLARAERSHPGNLSAFELLIRAKSSFNTMTEDGIREARRLILRALDLDPDFPLALTYLAMSYYVEYYDGWGDRAAAWAAMEDAVARAARIDPGYGRTLYFQGVFAFRRGEVERGRALWERAVATYPNDVPTLKPIAAGMTVALGPEAAEEALALMERARALDPLHTPTLYGQRAVALYFAGRYAEAVADLRKMPYRWPEAQMFLALSLSRLGETEAARAKVAELLRTQPDFSAEDWLALDIYQPGGAAAAELLTGARAAGLPICAADPAAIEPARRLPECEARRAAAAAVTR
jgi:TolB-like protein/DNA-binding winged helix-turn-helix (wHTH) protein/tetratricopeptide (TPR) repeat protein